jgi:hypothetical protein
LLEGNRAYIQLPERLTLVAKQHITASTLPLAEREFTTQIRDLARTLGWRRYHTWLAAHSTAGYPDECLVRPTRLIYAELKSDVGKATPAQQEWLDDLASCGVEVYLWRPTMIDQIGELLKLPVRPLEPGPGAWVPAKPDEPERNALQAKLDQATFEELTM